MDIFRSYEAKEKWLSESCIGLLLKSLVKDFGFLKEYRNEYAGLCKDNLMIIPLGQDFYYNLAVITLLPALSPSMTADILSLLRVKQRSILFGFLPGEC